MVVAIKEQFKPSETHELRHHIHVLQIALELMREDVEHLPMPEQSRAELLASLDRLPKWGAHER